MGFRAGGKNLDTGSFARRQEYYGDEVGRPDCRDAWAHLALWLRQPSTTKLVNIVTAWEKILADGTLTPQRGATITVEEYEHALAMQAKRGGGPTKILPQPKHPGKK
jgi:hypothetical protein